ncbi:phosphopantetheine-binding protein [Acidiferrobacter sp.]|uniref:phosphopantetheine-binding protein n=1 Tax=Acidiferrobacter sp. TaxID=1872107 RepID=UPI00261CD5D3|nr:phosphopantetheine-binding protein [Acidiferrobacter sp.]
MNSGQTEFEREIAQLLVSSLNLTVEAGAIDPEAPLFREGLGLDSIDMLEIALAISQHYGIQLRSDDPDNAVIFASLRALAGAIGARRTETGR